MRWLAATVTIGCVLMAAGCLARGDPPAVGAIGNAKRGRVLAGWYGCASCHDMKNAAVSGRVGPPLGGVGKRSYLAGRLPNTPQNLIHWIRDPQQVDPGTVMPDMRVTDRDARDIVAFLYTLP